MNTEGIQYIEHPGKEYDRLRYRKTLLRILTHPEVTDAIKKIVEDALQDAEPDKENKP